MNETEENNIYTLNIFYQNINYKIHTLKLKQSINLNYSNLNDAKILNFIGKDNVAFELNKENSSYLIMYMNQKYLINKINNSIILTNMFNKKSQIIKNKENFKLGLNDFILYNNSTILIPMINKKIFDNNYGVSYNMYIPRI